MNRKILSRIFYYIKSYKTYLVFSGIFAILSVFFMLYSPVLIGESIDLIVEKGNVDFKKLVFSLVKLGVSVALSSMFHWIMNLCTNKVAYNTVVDIRKNAFDKIQQLPLKYLDSHSHGDILSRVITDIEQVSDGLLHGFSQLFTGIITILGTVIFMVTINVKIALIVIVLTPLSLIASSLIAKNSFKMFGEQSRIRGEMTGLVDEIVSNQAEIKLFCYEDKAQERFEEINARLSVVGTKAMFYSALSNPGTRFINSIVYAAVAITGAFSVISGNFSVGMLSSFLAYASQYTKPFNEISGVITEFQNAAASAARVFAIIDETPEVPEKKITVDEIKCDGNVAIKNVSFSYSVEKPFIEGLDLTALSGQRIAIVGPTGCGKTTVINLLMRFYEINCGEITVSNVNITDMKRNVLRSMYGMVLQDTWLFSGSIRDNISYGKPNATDEEVISAAKASYAHSFIKRLPNGYDTMISEDGESISQGEKQLLCIARIMLTLPPMLILDEATSSIDTRTEVKIQHAFSKMMQGRTSFIVAHRLSTIKNADTILVMKDGKIVEKGNHTQLIQNNGFYSNLYNSQFAENR